MGGLCGKSYNCKAKQCNSYTGVLHDSPSRLAKLELTILRLRAARKRGTQSSESRSESKTKNCQTSATAVLRSVLHIPTRRALRLSGAHLEARYEGR